MRKFAPLLLVAMLALAACGGGSDNKSDDTNTGDGNTDNTEAPDGDSGDSGDSDSIKELFENQSKAKIRATYTTSSSGTESENVYTISQDGTGKVAYYTNDGETHIIVDGETFITCNNVTTEPECTEQPAAAGQAMVLGLTGLATGAQQAVANADDTAFTDASDETIGGRSAKCVSLDIATLEYKICVDEETGITLLYEGSVGGQGLKLEATEVGDPQDSDFTPDAPVEESDISLPDGITIPSLPGGITVP